MQSGKPIRVCSTIGISAVLACCAFAPLATADDLRLDARALFEKGVIQDLRLSADGTAIELDEGELVEDDGPAAGYSYQPNEERLSDRVWIRKELLIARPQTKRATLLVGPGGDFRAEINGKPIELRAAGKVGGYWQSYQLPPDALRSGNNAVVLHGTGKVWIARADEFAAGSAERAVHPNRSARSTDGGKTWDDRRLGTDADIDGEYYVRLFLDHYRPSGSLTLPVIDAGNLAGRQVAGPVASLGAVQIRLEGEAGSGGRIRPRVRTGNTPLADSKDWSDWVALDAAGGVVRSPRGRYLQVAVELGTSHGLQTPRLKSLAIEASPKRGDGWTTRLRVTETHNEEIIRSSVPFAYEPLDHARLKTLRERFKLDAVVADAQDELGLMTRLARWSAAQWAKGHLREGYPPWDALEILRPHSDGMPVGGFCQQYNLVFLQACESFGLTGRAVSIGAGDHGGRIKGSGHEVVEIWSNQFRKWVYIDGNLAWYAVDAATKVPLSLLELRQRQLRVLRGEAAAAIQTIHLADTPRRWTGLDGWPAFLELRLVPRSNFLEQRWPLPLNQGMRGWFWAGHHVWTDAQYPASLLYGQRVISRNNFEWTLNQAHYVLEAPDQPGTLRVHLDTQTPSFETFLADIDRGGKMAVAASFLWKLNPGPNRLEVRSRNKVGCEGIASWIVVEYDR
jgi:hypothetical protein